MPRLLRPHIPLEVRCRVALRQLGELFIDVVIEAERDAVDPTVNPTYRKGRGFAALLARKLDELAMLLGVESRAFLHLDHDPALGAREKVFRDGEHVGYRPDANDPAHLIYRTKEAHRIKTLVRGEHGQFPDRVLIKRERKRSRKAKRGAKKKKQWPSRGFPKGRKMRNRACRTGRRTDW